MKKILTRKKLNWKIILMKKIRYNIFSGFPFPEVQEIFP